MPYVVSLEDFTPGQRYDSLSWTGAFIKESATRTGTYTTRDTITFADPDADPENPASRDFTTDNATLAAGWYKVVFFDAAGAVQEAPAVYFPHPGMRPTVAEVATLLRARTVDNANNYIETFNADTVPTAAQAELLIDQALADVEMRVSQDIHESLYDPARHVVAIRTAMLIESGYLPEQTGDDNTVYINFRFQYAEQIEKLVHAAQLWCAFSEPVEETV